MKKPMKKMAKRGTAKLKTKAASKMGKAGPKVLKSGDKGDKKAKVKAPGAKKMSEKSFEKKYGDASL